MTPQELQLEADRLTSLVDTAPMEVIVSASNLTTDDPDIREEVASVRAALLIDAGILASNSDAVNDGIETIETLLAGSSPLLRVEMLRYYLANGLLGSCDLTPGVGSPAWYEQTNERRAKARLLLSEVGRSDSFEPDLRAQALTNLGNRLSQAHRYIEAYDAYRDALKVKPGFGMAALNAAVSLHHVGRLGLAGVHAKQRTYDLLRQAERARDEVREVGGRGALEILERYLAELEPPEEELETAPGLELHPEEAWVAEHHLALVPGVESFRPELIRWDSLHLYPYAEVGDRPTNAPAAFTMFNAMKQSYILARSLAYQAIEEPPKSDTAQYADTLDYALWGPGMARLIESPKIAVGILDRVAVAVNAELDTSIPAHRIYFHSYWETDQAQSHIQTELEAGNTVLIALRDIAADLAESGALFQQRDVRNAATHRFIAIHDLPYTDHVRPSETIDRFELEAFQKMVIRSLQLARAALIHYTEFLGIRSARLRDDGEAVLMPLVLPPHHFIRDLDDPPPSHPHYPPT